MRAQLPLDERQRLEKLLALKLLDSLPEESFSSLVEGVNQLLDMPIVLISLIDQDRQWFKAKVGLEICETSRDSAFCAHAILQSEPLIVNDATLDSRFSDNSLVTGDFHIRFYAGAPITVDGLRIGTLCCLDRVPRSLTEGQILGLKRMAAQVANLIAMRNIQQSLELSESRFETAVNSMHEGLVLQNREGEILISNSRACEILGLTLDQLKGRKSVDPRWRSTHEDGTDWPGAEHPAMIALQTGQPVTGQVMGVHKPDGNHSWILINAVPMFTATSTEPYAVVATFLEITEQKTQEKRMAEHLALISQYSDELELLNNQIAEQNIDLSGLAMKDGLTGINNNRAFRERLDEMISAFSRSGRGGSLIIMDLDHFKSVNDTFGHQAGDDTLIQFARILDSCTREEEFAARYGGEEFVLLMPGIGSEEAFAAAERLRVSIASAHWAHRHVTASFGVATLGLYMDAAQFVEAADKALYFSKSSGRNRVTHAYDLTDPNKLLTS